VKYPPRQKAASFNLDAVMAQLGPAIAAEKALERFFANYRRTLCGVSRSGTTDQDHLSGGIWSGAVSFDSRRPGSQ